MARGLMLTCLTSALLTLCAHAAQDTVGSCDISHQLRQKQSLHETLKMAFCNSSHALADEWVDSLQKELHPLFDALPKNSIGLLGHSSARYALHRHFTHRHAMHVKGFEPAGQAWNSSSPMDMLTGRVAPEVERRFKETLADGFVLKDLALLAATFEHIARREDVERLVSTYRSLSLDTADALSREDLDKVVEVYMALYIMGGRSVINREDNVAQSLVKAASKRFPSFAETLKHMRQMQVAIIQNEAGDDGALVAFDVVEKIVAEMTRNFGRQQNTECKALSKTLVAKESRLSGRVLLSDLYQEGSRFTDTKEDLLEIGAAEKAVDSAGSEVIYLRIPNYVYSAANCLVSTSVYSVCCMDACEGLLRHVEERVAAPTASLEDITSIVTDLASPKAVGEKRALPAGHLERLKEIADMHGGQVYLHGRLFALWLHHVFPRACPVPAKASPTATPTAAGHWLRDNRPNMWQTQEQARVARVTTPAEMSAGQVQHLSDDEVEVRDLVDGQDFEGSDSDLPWDSDEELVFHHAQPTSRHEVRVILRAAVAVGALYSLVRLILGSASQVASAWQQRSPEAKPSL